MQIYQAILDYERWKGIHASRSTMSGYGVQLRQFGLFVGAYKQVEAITINDIANWFQGMIDLGWQQNSFLPKASALRDFFVYLKGTNLDVIDPKLIVIPRKEHKPLEVINTSDFKRIVKYVNTNSKDLVKKRDLAVLWLLWDTGVRVGELCSLNVKQIDKNKALIKTEKAKHSRPFRTIHWSKEAQICVEDWLKQRTAIETDHDALFVGLDARKQYKRISSRSVQRVVKDVSHNLEIPTLTPHTFRHSKAHRVLEQGGNGADVMNLLGHSNLSTSSRYVEMAGKELENRAKLLM